MQLIKACSTTVALSLTIPGCCGHQFDAHSYAPDDIMIVDVAVIGGGATGSYAAITLSDLDKSVVVVEATGVLGGHTNTFVDPATGTSIDYGVQRYENDAGALAFFDRLGVTYTSLLPQAAANTTYTDFTTEKRLQFVPGVSLPGAAAKVPLLAIHN